MVVHIKTSSVVGDRSHLLSVEINQCNRKQAVHHVNNEVLRTRLSQTLLSTMCIEL